MPHQPALSRYFARRQTACVAVSPARSCCWMPRKTAVCCWFRHLAPRIARSTTTIPSSMNSGRLDYTYPSDLPADGGSAVDEEGSGGSLNCPVPAVSSMPSTFAATAPQFCWAERCSGFVSRRKMSDMAQRPRSPWQRLYLHSRNPGPHQGSRPQLGASFSRRKRFSSPPMSPAEDSLLCLRYRFRQKASTISQEGVNGTPFALLAPFSAVAAIGPDERVIYLPFRCATLAR